MGYRVADSNSDSIFAVLTALNLITIVLEITVALGLDTGCSVTDGNSGTMIEEGIKPNDVTFVGVLSACSHAGLISRGWMYFTSMSDVYGVTPKVEHYGCMVDILGRAGYLKEARELISSIPFAPDAIVWRALLGACRMDKNVELAEEAIVNLLELEPHVDGNYVLLSNIYSQAKRWGEVAKIRRIMRGKIYAIQEQGAGEAVEHLCVSLRKRRGPQPPLLRAFELQKLEDEIGRRVAEAKIRDWERE
ncbi:pentatricopeptide repeat-containing protein At3g26782, mitochondrial-like [Telopea speciosissima]|uniref:pentatricopeptide repeat-containing protein At3g26782, mitochondrial-like n=1 Tax=Telopea speciosissima TaxID=54955 RepID=UPI001CC44D38|nr:pentatricopeptide repeat-containing protein At3g26782, mitochondrial-like [Telopea speciosissima]